jgi:hypothetical protein
MVAAATSGVAQVALACEDRVGGFLGQPADTVSSLAFVVAGLAILAGHPYGTRARVPYGLLLVAVGVGSVIQHGPHPDWQAYAHDLSLGAVLAYVAVDAARDLSGRRLRASWWLAPTAALAPLIAISPAASRAAQAGLAAVAVGLGLVRARARPRLRRTLLPALAVLAAGALVGTLGERTALCQPESPLQGHALWHVLAATALWLLTPAIAGGPATRVDHVPSARHAGQHADRSP